MTPSAVALVRFLLMWATLWAICGLWRIDTRIQREHWPRVLFAGCMSMGIYMIFFLGGMGQTSPAEGSIILATAPILTYLFSIVLRQEKLQWLALLGTAIAFGGVSMVILGGHLSGSGSLVGNLLVAVSAVLWATSVLQMRPLLQIYQPLPLMTQAMAGAVIPLAIFGGRDALQIHPETWNAVTWANLAQMVFGSGLVGFLGIYRGVREVGPTVATRYQLTIPMIATFFSWLIYHQTPQPLQWLGMIVVISGIALAAYARSRPAKPSAPL